MVAICHSRPERVVDVDVDLGRIERAVLGLEDVRDVPCRECLPDQLLGALPERRVPECLVRLGGEREPGLEADPAIRLAHFVEEGRDLVGELVRSDEQVRIVLDELADPGKPAEGPRSLVSMQPAKVAVTERQVAIGTQVRAVDECALRAVHRLEAEGLALGLDQEHVVAVQVPVARLPP